MLANAFNFTLGFHRAQDSVIRPNVKANGRRNLCWRQRLIQIKNCANRFCALYIRELLHILIRFRVSVARCTFLLPFAMRLP